MKLVFHLAFCIAHCNWNLV